MSLSTLVVAMGLSFFGVSDSFARIGDAEPSRWSRQRAVKPEIASYLGEVRCTSGSLEFVRKEDGKVFEIENNPELLAASCGGSKAHLQIQMTAERKPQILFWGGELVVKDFTILGTMRTHLCAVDSKMGRGFRGREAI